MRRVIKRTIKTEVTETWTITWLDESWITCSSPTQNPNTTSTEQASSSQREDDPTEAVDE